MVSEGLLCFCFILENVCLFFVVMLLLFAVVLQFLLLFLLTNNPRVIIMIVAKLINNLFGVKEVRALMLALDASGRTTMLYTWQVSFILVFLSLFL